MTTTEMVGKVYSTANGETVKVVAANGENMVDVVRWIKSRQTWSKSASTTAVSRLTPAAEPTR